MGLTRVFSTIVHGAWVGLKRLPQILNILEDHAGQIEQIAEKAVNVITMIDAIAPNRNLDELQALGNKFLLHVTPEIVANPLQVESLLQDAAVVELKKAFPDTPNSLLRTGIALAFNVVKAKQKAEG